MHKKDPLLDCFDRGLERLADVVKPPLSLDCQLQFNVNSKYYQQLLQIENDQLVKPVSPSDVMIYKGYPIFIDDRFSFFTISPIQE